LLCPRPPPRPVTDLALPACSLLVIMQHMCNPTNFFASNDADFLRAGVVVRGRRRVRRGRRAGGSFRPLPRRPFGAGGWRRDVGAFMRSIPSRRGGAAWAGVSPSSSASSPLIAFSSAAVAPCVVNWSTRPATSSSGFVSRHRRLRDLRLPFAMVHYPSGVRVALPSISPPPFPLSRSRVRRRLSFESGRQICSLQP